MPTTAFISSERGTCSMVPGPCCKIGCFRNGGGGIFFDITNVSAVRGKVRAQFFGENIPYRNDKRGNDGSDDNARNPEYADAAQNGNENERVRHFRLTAEEYGAQEIIDRTYNGASADKHDKRRDKGACRKKKESGGEPYEDGAYSRDDGKKSHHRSPKNRVIDAGYPKDNPPDSALCERHDDGPFHNRARGRREACKERALFIIT